MCRTSGRAPAPIRSFAPSSSLPSRNQHRVTQVVTQVVTQAVRTLKFPEKIIFWLCYVRCVARPSKLVCPRVLFAALATQCFVRPARLLPGRRCHVRPGQLLPAHRRVRLPWPKPVKWRLLPASGHSSPFRLRVANPFSILSSILLLLKYYPFSTFSHGQGDLETLYCQPFLTKLRGYDGALGAMVGHV